jgi:hypothetical protein
MRLALALSFITASLLLSPTAQAKDIGVKPEELIGKWIVTGNSLGDGKYILSFLEDGQVTLQIKAGSASSSATGAKWSYTEGRISFEGLVSAAGLKVTGTWVADWTNADEILITVARGNQYTLKRMEEKK